MQPKSNGNVTSVRPTYGPKNTIQVIIESDEKRFSIEFQDTKCYFKNTYDNIACTVLHT